MYLSLLRGINEKERSIDYFCFSGFGNHVELPSAATWQAGGSCIYIILVSGLPRDDPELAEGEFYGVIFAVWQVVKWIRRRKEEKRSL